MVPDGRIGKSELKIMGTGLGLAILPTRFEGKGGALMNDLEIIALDLQIYLGLNPEITGVARMLLLFSLLPTVVALVWYFERARWHRVLRALHTVET